MSAQRKLTPNMYINKKFGKLFITGPEAIIPNNKGYNARYVYGNCDCGNKNVLIDLARLMKGESQSCGCSQIEAREKFSQGRKDGTVKTVPARLVHGDSVPGAPYYNLHHIWTGMRRRCNNPHDKSYPDYGGKGIKVCPEWDADYRVFKEWALSNGYIVGLSIDRIDNSKGYYPENCRWSSDYMQANNKTNNTYITVDGETHTKAEWARFYGLNPYYGFNDWNKHGQLTNEEVVQRFKEEKRICKPFLIVNEKQYEEGNKKFKGEDKNESVE